VITTVEAGSVVGTMVGAPVAGVEGSLVGLAPGVSDVAAEADGEAAGTLDVGKAEPDGTTDGSGVVPQLAIRLPITRRATTAARTTRPTPTTGRRDIDCMDGRSVRRGPPGNPAGLVRVPVQRRGAPQVMATC
jgi:hypothetical protein